MQTNSAAERSPMEPRRQTRNNGLDALRGVAIALVLMYHFQQYMKNWYPETGGISHGYPGLVMSYFWVGVDLFYVLSGFFVSLAVLRYATWDPHDFAKRRLTRILPAYYVSMVLVLLLVESYLLKDWKGWANIGLHVVMLHQWQQWTMTAIDGPYWTLGIEFAFYCVMLAVAPWWRARNGWLLIPFFWGISIIWRVSVFAGFPVAERFFWSVQIPGALDEFAMGLLAACAYHRGWLSRFDHRPFLRSLVLFALGLSITGYAFFSYVHLTIEYWSQAWYVLGSRTVLCFGFAICILAVACLREGNRVLRLLNALGLSALGKISYSVYLYHIPILILFYRYTELAYYSKWLYISACMGTILLTSWISYRLVETRFHPTA
jgi:peptidoglycan/LPS O-acetylase OafA/YrhL